MEILNRKVYHDYFIDDIYEAGIVLEEAVHVKGLTLIPIKLYFKNNILKVSLGVCRGKKSYDKRESIKERDIKREALRNIKNYS